MSHSDYRADSQRYPISSVAASLSGVGTGFNLTQNDVINLARQYTNGGEQLNDNNSGDEDIDTGGDTNTIELAPIETHILQRQLSEQSTTNKQYNSTVTSHDDIDHLIDQFLDPNDDTQLFDRVPNWSMADIQRLIDRFEPYNYPTIVKKLRQRRRSTGNNPVDQNDILAWSSLSHMRGDDLLLDHIDGYLKPGMYNLCIMYLTIIFTQLI